ncbi:MAG TPA: response regulator [Polyangia bacterium]|jgi:CheY-like chemotaxis protein|nr:response regulator [Polyangia bacterium]
MPPDRTVLVVEDDGDLSDTLKVVIEDQGWRAICAANGREALALLERERPALMLVDLFMPIMNGVELLKIVKRNATLAAIPRVIMTAANDRMIGVKEDVPVLYKPVDVESLTRLLAQYGEPRPASAS